MNLSKLCEFLHKLRIKLPFNHIQTRSTMKYYVLYERPLSSSEKSAPNVWTKFVACIKFGKSRRFQLGASWQVFECTWEPAGTFVKHFPRKFTSQTIAMSDLKEKCWHFLCHMVFGLLAWGTKRHPVCDSNPGRQRTESLRDTFAFPSQAETS